MEEKINKEQILPKPANLFIALPRVCKLQWADHYTAVVSVPQFVKYMLIEERYVP